MVDGCVFAVGKKQDKSREGVLKHQSFGKQQVFPQNYLLIFQFKCNYA